MGLWGGAPEPAAPECTHVFLVGTADPDAPLSQAVADATTAALRPVFAALIDCNRVPKGLPDNVSAVPSGPMWAVELKLPADTAWSVASYLEAGPHKSVTDVVAQAVDKHLRLTVKYMVL